MTGWVEGLRGWWRGEVSRVPFTVEEIVEPDAEVDALFMSSFRAAAPRFPLHFIVRWNRDRSVAGYVHYTAHEPGVYLCGGLCVDVRPYRRMSAEDRATMRVEGSLSRWMSRESIARLPDKQAVFAYTGNPMSIRDALALDFQRTSHPHLMVQWHAAPVAARVGIVDRVASIGPF